jgi:iron complex outermembrane receptor protein
VFRKSQVSLAPVLICVLAAPAAAQRAENTAQQPPLTLEQLMSIDVERVFGASRFQQSVLDAPSAVSIVTRDDIERFGYRTLADILRSVRGFYTSNDRNYSYVGVAGFLRPGDYNTRVLLLIDGHRLNDNVFDEALIGTEFPLDVELIDRVEVVRGPASSLYGTNAFFGIVNVITKRAGDLGRFSGSVDAGSLGTRRIRGTFSRLFSNGASAIVSFTGFHSDGQRRLFYPELSAVTRTSGIASGLDDDASSQVFATLTFGGWKAQTVWGNRNKRIPTGAFETAIDDNRSRTRDLRGYVEAAYEGNRAGTSILWRGAYDRYFYDGTYALDLPAGFDPDPFRDNSRGDWISTEASVSRVLSRAHHVSGGVELRGNLRQNQAAGYESAPTAELDDRRSSRVVALFAQDEFRLARQVLLNIGVRHDSLSLSGSSATSPRAALIVSPRRDAALKLMYGEAFRAPNAFELFYYGAAAGDLQLQPERVRSSEIAWEQYLARRVRVQTTAFFNSVRNLITQQPATDATGPIQLPFENAGAIRARGVGIETEARLTSQLNLHGSYQFQLAKAAESDTPLTNSPRHLTHAALTHRTSGGRLVTSTEFLAVGRRFALDGTASPAFGLWNASIGAPLLVPRVALQLDIRNILDHQYGDPGAEEHRQALIPQDGRTLRLRATWRF